MKKFLRYFILAVFICPLPPDSYRDYILHAQDSSRMVLIETSYGSIKVKLYNETPLHRDNFLKLIEKHFYDSLLFHRVINTFMIQGGDPDSKHAKATDTLGDGDVGYTIPSEFNPKYFHKRGALAAARNGDEENPEQASSGCQFYIVQGKTWNDSLLDLKAKRIMNMKAYNRLVKNPDNKKLIEEYVKAQKEDPDKTATLKKKIDKLSENELIHVSPYKFTLEQKTTYKTIGGTPHLDGSYTVFGEVMEGMEAVDKIASALTDGLARPMEDIRMKITIIK